MIMLTAATASLAGHDLIEYAAGEIYDIPAQFENSFKTLNYARAATVAEIDAKTSGAPAVSAPAPLTPPTTVNAPQFSLQAAAAAGDPNAQEALDELTTDGQYVAETTPDAAATEVRKRGRPSNASRTFVAPKQ
jgi:hypothetical protein